MATGKTSSRLPRLSFSFSVFFVAAVVVIASCFGHHATSNKPGGGANKLLLLMIDGFRWDYFDMFGKDALPGFNKLRQSGVSAESFVPVFPTLSYVNYYSIMTGESLRWMVKDNRVVVDGHLEKNRSCNEQ
jgi:predicted AlkP superfamily pyrophosphatase or phosphodiesterase